MKQIDYYFDSVNGNWNFFRTEMGGIYTNYVRLGKDHFILTTHVKNDIIQELITAYDSDLWFEIHCPFPEDHVGSFPTVNEIEQNKYDCLLIEFRKLMEVKNKKQYQVISGGQALLQYKSVVKILPKISWVRLLHKAEQDGLVHLSDEYRRLEFKCEFDQWLREVRYCNGIPESYFSEIFTDRCIEDFVKYQKEKERLLQMKEDHRKRERQLRSGVI